MNNEEYISLYEKYISGKCTAEEKEKLFSYEDHFQLLDVDRNDSADDEVRKAKLFSNIQKGIQPKQSPILPMYWRWTAAAVILISLGFTFFFINQQPVKTQAALIKPILPGRNVAILTLADQSTIALDQIKDGITVSGKTQISKLKDGEISYRSNHGSSAEPAPTHTITIPRGGQYHITLQDGTEVWLNAGSSLTFPTFFEGKERKVKLEGEAYFEVAKNKQMPFKVDANTTEIEVLGTHFNVNAYREEGMVKTTLLEGSVRLRSDKAKVTLHPDQQGTIVLNTEQIDVKPVKADDAVAWKNGLFLFRDENIISIMNKVSRWYNVEVSYRGEVAHLSFGGSYSKYKNLEELLKGLELTGLVHFKIEGRRVIVMP